MCTPAAVTAAVNPLGASVTVTSLVHSTAYSPTLTSCCTHHCLDSILNILTSSPTGWFNIRASLPPCLASLPQYLWAPSVCTLLPACFNCAALPHHTPCCLEHGCPSRPFIFSIFTVATLFFLFIVSMVTSLAPLSLRQPRGMVSFMGVSWECTPSLLLGSPFLNPSLRSPAPGGSCCVLPVL